VAPATLASLAASGTLLTHSGEQAILVIGPLVPAVVAALAVMYWRRNLLLAIVAAVVVAALLRQFA
jgi:branched-subunit amino acid transport protein